MVHTAEAQSKRERTQPSFRAAAHNMPDWVADPRLGQVAFGQLKAFMLEATSGRGDESTRLAVADAMTKFSLAALAEERSVDLQPLLELAAPLASLSFARAEPAAQSRPHRRSSLILRRRCGHWRVRRRTRHDHCHRRSVA